MIFKLLLKPIANKFYAGRCFLLDRRGFASVVEVVVSAVFFAVVGIGIFSSLSTLRPQGQESFNKLEAAYAAKALMEELRNDVDASTWNDPNSNLAVGVTHTRTIGAFTINYTLQPVLGSNAREMVMNVTYP